MPMLLIDLLDAPARLEGVLTRRLIEVRPGVFVGSLSKRAIEAMWKAVIDAAPRAALLVYASKTELGISLQSIGEHQYQVVDNFGLDMISVVNSKKFGKSLN